MICETSNALCEAKTTRCPTSRVTGVLVKIWAITSLAFADLAFLLAHLCQSVGYCLMHACTSRPPIPFNLFPTSPQWITAQNALLLQSALAAVNSLPSSNPNNLWLAVEAYQRWLPFLRDLMLHAESHMIGMGGLVSCAPCILSTLTYLDRFLWSCLRYKYLWLAVEAYQRWLLFLRDLMLHAESHMIGMAVNHARACAKSVPPNQLHPALSVPLFPGNDDGDNCEAEGSVLRILFSILALTLPASPSLLRIRMQTITTRSVFSPPNFEYSPSQHGGSRIRGFAQYSHAHPCLFPLLSSKLRNTDHRETEEDWCYQDVLVDADCFVNLAKFVKEGNFSPASQLNFAYEKALESAYGDLFDIFIMCVRWVDNVRFYTVRAEYQKFLREIRKAVKKLGRGRFCVCLALGAIGCLLQFSFWRLSFHLARARSFVLGGSCGHDCCT